MSEEFSVAIDLKMMRLESQVYELKKMDVLVWVAFILIITMIVEKRMKRMVLIILRNSQKPFNHAAYYYSIRSFIAMATAEFTDSGAVL